MSWESRTVACPSPRWSLLVAAQSVAFAQDSTGRTELRRADLSGAPNMEVILSITELKPGDVISEHFHHGIEAGYILEGGTVEQAGKPPITFTSPAHRS